MDQVTKREKIRFLIHFAIFAAVILLSALVNARMITGFQWWLLVSLGWGIIVMIHFLYIFMIKPMLVSSKEEKI